MRLKGVEWVKQILSIGLGIFIGGNVPFLYAANEFTCGKYSKLAVEQNRQNLDKSCGLEGPRWSSDRSYHTRWCVGTRELHLEKESLARAEALNNCGAEPLCSEGRNVSIHLKEIKVVDEADGTGDAEPYLWPVFFKVDVDTKKKIDSMGENVVENLLKNKNGNSLSQVKTAFGEWMSARDGAHRNLGDTSVSAGDIITIPLSLGWYETTLKVGNEFSERDAPFVGVAVALLEEDHLPSSEDIVNTHYPKFVLELIDKIVTAVRFKAYGLLTEDTTISQKIQSDLLSTSLGAPFADDFLGVIYLTHKWGKFDQLQTYPHNIIWGEDNGSQDGDFSLSLEISGFPVCAR